MALGPNSSRACPASSSRACPTAPADPQAPPLRIITWNVAGLRGLLRRAPQALADLLKEQTPDLLCLQETRLQERDIAAMQQLDILRPYFLLWHCSTDRLGHAGVAMFSRRRPTTYRCGLPGAAFDTCGRALSVALNGIVFINVYVPNAGDQLKNLRPRLRQWDPALGAYVASLTEHGHKVVLLGDLNVAPQPLDVYDPLRLQHSAGFSPQERRSFARHLLAQGLVDVWRHLHPNQQQFSFFSWRGGMRAKQKGWRLDHFLLPQQLLPQVVDCSILPTPTASDHQPVRLWLKPTFSGDEMQTDAPVPLA